MDTEILKIIVGGIATASGAIGGVGLKTYLENKPLFQVTGGRKKKLDGSWRGHFYQNNENISEFDIELKAGRKKITGTGIIRRNEGKVKLEGGYRNDRFLKLEYQNADNEIIQFGTVILELAPDNKMLQGDFVGYGPLSKKIITGTIEMKKV